MLVKLPFYAAPSNFRFTPKNAQIMLDSQNNTTLIPENALFHFKPKMGRFVKIFEG